MNLSSNVGTGSTGDSFATLKKRKWRGRSDSKLSFLPRNVVKGYEYLHKIAVENETKNDIYDGHGPPLKIRRIEKPHMDQEKTFSSTSNCCKARKKSTESPLEQAGCDFQKGFIIELDSIDRSPHAVGEERILSKVRQYPVDIECTCTVALYYRYGTRETYKLMCRKEIKTCLIRLEADQKNTITRTFIQPDENCFVFFWDDFDIEDPSVGRHQGFPADCRIEVSIRQAGDQDIWPPFDMPSEGALKRLSAYKSQFRIFSEIQNITQPDLVQDPVPVALSFGSTKQYEDYYLNFSIRWSKPPTLGTSWVIFETVPTIKSPVERMEINSSLDSTDALTDRTLKEPTSIGAWLPEEYTVHQRYPGLPFMTTHVGTKFHTTTHYPDDEVEIEDGINCILCGSMSQNLDYLRMHFRQYHLTQIVTFKSTDTLYIREDPDQPDNENLSVRTFSLSRPQGYFNFQRYLEGDNSWVESRQFPEQPTTPEQLSSASPDEDLVPISSNTSQSSDDIIFLPRLKSPAPLPQIPIRPRKVIKVPASKQRLYHFITKKVLVKGQELSDSDEDETWLEQRHKDIINDYEDVDDDVKEYINRWNPFITRFQLSIRTFLAPCIARFVEENKRWLNERKERRRQFVEHARGCIVRRDLKDEEFRACLAVLDTDREVMISALARAVPKKGRTIPTCSRKRRRLYECICYSYVVPSQAICCSGSGNPAEQCPGTFYHRKCAKEDGYKPTDLDWRCATCAPIFQEVVRMRAEKA